jgi:hypothetical protein
LDYKRTLFAKGPVKALDEDDFMDRSRVVKKKDEDAAPIEFYCLVIIFKSSLAYRIMEDSCTLAQQFTSTSFFA